MALEFPRAVDEIRGTRGLTLESPLRQRSALAGP